MRYLYLLLVATLCVSCEMLFNVITNIEQETEICIIADVDEEYTRVALDGNTTSWEVGDRITVALYNSDIKYAELEIKSEGDISKNGKSAKFRGKVPVGSYTKVTALYPAMPITNHAVTLDRNAEDNIFMLSQSGDKSYTVVDVTADGTAELPITFEHLMHKVDFNITYDDEDVFEDIIVKISATSGGEPIEFVKVKSYNFAEELLADSTLTTSITTQSKSALYSSMLFPLERVDDVVFTFSIYYDGVKKYEIRNPKEGSHKSFSMDAGMSTTINLEALHPAEYSVNYNSSVSAKGVMATISLSNVAYMVDEEKSDIKTLRLEYALDKTNKEWTAIDIDGAQLNDGNEVVEIPAQGKSYLSENSNYVYRLTFVPKDDSLETITTEEHKFKTTYAEITAEISKPTVKIVDNELNIYVDVVRPYFDGVHIPDYENLYYCIIYRMVGEERWNAVLAEYANETMSLTMSLDEFVKGEKYEFKSAIIAGVEENILGSNSSAYVTIPKEETPTPPAPPITGDADTTALAGEWQLTSWRGAKPSFDVYLSITPDGIVTLWQRISSRSWETYYSTVGYENGVIAGTYTDGVAWSTSYSVTVDGDTMTWVDTTDSTDVSVYTRCTLPDFTNDATRATAISSTRFL